ncbi:MAG: hypothetical protein Q4E57_08395 [Eubacteriales bacterium]|nr:hypothetical protein [Eubacteriales bacterium]
MKKKLSILALFMIIAVLLCDINISFRSNAYCISELEELSGSDTDEGRIMPVNIDPALIDFCTPEFLNGRLYAPILSGGQQVRGMEANYQFARILAIWSAFLCVIEIAFRRFKFSGLPTRLTGAASAILLYIQDTDGKK